MMLPDRSDLFYPDGQAKGEIFEYNSFQLSKMAHKGVTCLDCHDPHSGQLSMSMENNGLCLSCHQSPGLRGAVPIDPVAHSHHPPGSKGNQCVECHMPAKAFMLRDFRRDHAFTIPDPLLTQELGIPNACNSCHQGQSTQWALRYTQKWFGDKMERLGRDRARLLARVEKQDPKVWPELLKLAREEEIPAWRATLVAYLGNWVQETSVREFLIQSLNDDSYLVRASAVRSLSHLPRGS